MIGCLVSILLLIQFSSFSLLRSLLSDSTPICTVLLYVEILKLLVSSICARDRRSNLFQRPFAILVPTLSFVLMNLISYWVVSNTSATAYVMLMQLKIPMTCVVSYCVLNLRYSIDKIFCIFLICVSCMNICVSKKELKSNSLNFLTIGGCLVEVFLSSLCSVYMQKIFENKLELLWIRNMELSFLSMIFYICMIVFNDYPFNCSFVGYIFSVLGASGGILVALTLIYCGAVEKTIASSLSLVVVGIIEHIIYNRYPSITIGSFYIICFVSVLMYHSDILSKKEREILKSPSTPLLSEEGGEMND